MSPHARRQLPGNAPRHARLASKRRASALAFATVVAAGTALVAGPATAHESSRLTPIAPVEAALGPLAVTDPVDAFEVMLAEGQQRALIAREVERQRVLAEQRERDAELAKKRARAQAAKVRASRAALRSAVVRPVDGGYRLTASFGDSSSQWGSGRHTGLDFACSAGTAVHAVADGVVIAAGFDGAYGNRIEIRHADGTVTTYNHLSSIEVDGGQVRADQVIGRVGTTGNTTGAHLHFEVISGGAPVDPAQWLARRYVAF